MCIPSQSICNCSLPCQGLEMITFIIYKIFDAFNVFEVSSLQGTRSMDLVYPFSSQLHHVAFDRLKSHTPFPCPATQSINMKFHCVFFILNFTRANAVISGKFYFRLNIWCDIINVKREQQGTKNRALGTLDKTRAQSDFTPYTTTRCCLKHRQESIHSNVLPPIP